MESPRTSGTFLRRCSRRAPAIVIALFVASCTCLPDDPKDTDGESPSQSSETSDAPSLEVLWDGCAAVLRGPVCFHDEGRAQLLLWIDVSPRTPLEVAFDGVPADVEVVEILGGTRIRINPPQFATRLGIRIKDRSTPGEFSLALTHDATTPSEDIQEIARNHESGKITASEARRAIYSIIPSTDDERRAFALNLLGKLAFVDDAFAEATETAETGFEVARIHGQYGLAAEMSIRAAYISYAVNHDYELARSWMNRAAEVAESPAAQLELRYHRSMFSDLLGQPTEALRAVQDIERLATALERQSLAIAALSQEMILTGRFGSTSRALDLARRARDLVPMVDSPLIRAQFLNDLGWMLLEAAARGSIAGDPIPVFLEALSVANERSRVPEQMRSIIRLNMSYAFLLQKDASTAKLHLLKVQDDHISHADRMWRRMLEARIALFEGDIGRAEASYVALTEDARTSHDVELRWLAQIGLGEVLEARAKPQLAKAAYREAEELIETHLHRIAVTTGRERYAADRDAGAHRLIALALDDGNLDEAFCLARLTRARTLHSLAVTARRNAESTTTGRREIDGYLANRARLESRLDESWLMPTAAGEIERRTIGRLRQASDENLDKILSTRSSDRARRTCSDLLTPSEGELDLYYSKIGSEWVVFASGQGGDRFHRLGVFSFDDLSFEGDLTPTRLDEVSTALLAPLSADIAAARVLRVTATDEMMKVPIHALTFGSDGAPLIDSVTVAYRLDLPVALRLEGRDKSAAVVAPSSNLAAANAEVDVVSNALRRGGWSTTILAGDAATGAETRAALGRADFVHFVGHARYDGIGGWDSALSLSTGGTLEVGDVLALLRVPSVVVLNGCETGVSDPRGSAGGMNLATAFVVAGARAVIATTSEVDDAAAAALMTAFYGALGDPGALGPASALRDAMMARRRHDDAWRRTRIWVP